MRRSILNVNCVFPACPASCDMGARRCFGNQAEDCCHFYDPANDKCLTQCPSDRIVTDDFDCAGVYIDCACTSMQIMH